MAASAGHIDCVKVLVGCGADISLIDEYGKTPKQTAELSSKKVIVRFLKSEGMDNIIVSIIGMINKCHEISGLYIQLIVYV